MNKSMKQVAMALAMAGAGAVDAAAPKAKAGKIIAAFHADNGWIGGKSKLMAKIDDGIATLQKICTTREYHALESLAADAYERKSQADAWDVIMDAHVAEIFGDKCPVAKYVPIIKAFREIFGAYPATCMRNAIKRRFKKLPNRGKGTGKGIKGMNPKKWFRGINTSVKGLMLRASKSPGGDIDGDVLREFTAVMKRLAEVRAKMEKRIAAK